MKHWTWVALAVAAALLGAGGFVYWQYRQVMRPAAAAPLDVAQAGAATRFLDLLDAGEFGDAHAMLDARGRDKLPEAELRKVWETLPRQLGGQPVRGPARGVAVDGKTYVAFALQFPLVPLEARIGFDPAGAIHTFRVVPVAPTPAAAPTAEDPFIEREFGVAGLGGTLALPRGAGPFPAVVLVHGSGPHDRDQTIGPNRPFLDLARGLAARGIAVLRYEKRSKARPGDFAGNDFTVDLETVDDAVAAIKALRADPAIDPARVFVAGHSLGAMMAPRVAQRAPELAGLVLLAAPARALVEVVPQQVRYLAALDGSVSADEQAQIAQIDAQAGNTRALRAGVDPAGELLLGIPAAYWLDLAGYDPVAVLASLPQRALIVQGARDYQVTPADDFARWQAAFGADPRVSLVLHEGLNHLFIAGSGTPGPAEYLAAGQVDAAVIDGIAAWLAAAPAK
jgi:dienelactone hydrolase